MAQGKYKYDNSIFSTQIGKLERKGGEDENGKHEFYAKTAAARNRNHKNGRGKKRRRATNGKKEKRGGNDIETRESKVGRTTKVVTFKRSSLTFLSHLLARTQRVTLFFARARKN